MKDRAAQASEPGTPTRWMRTATAGILLSASLFTLGVGHALPGCDSWLGPPYQGSDARIRFESVGGREVAVIVPPDYEVSSERYPVVYLIHGGVNRPDTWLTLTDLIAFTGGLPRTQQAIVVLPDGTLAPVWADWRNGALADESLFVQKIVPFIDARYRTVPHGRWRAIAGFSAGGLGATRLAARHPDMFAVAAGFSPLVNIDPERGRSGLLVGTGLVYGAGTAYGYCYDDPSLINPWGIFGNPLTEPVWTHDGNPADLAGNFRGLSVSLYSGNGVPCDNEDVEAISTALPWSTLEGAARAQVSDLSDALTAASVAHSLVLRDCGIHASRTGSRSYRYLEQDLRAWWPQMIDALGTQPPATFTYRSARPSFSVWGWTFEADPARAPEFLSVSDTSSTGLGLTGSGRTRVTTPPFFTPGETVLVDGHSLVADEEGRLTFIVDLGLPHQHQQFTPASRALEAAGGYWTSRTVSIR